MIASPSWFFWTIVAVAAISLLAEPRPNIAAAGFNAMIVTAGWLACYGVYRLVRRFWPSPK
jgi:hypothetical protein